MNSRVKALFQRNILYNVKKTDQKAKMERSPEQGSTNVQK